VILDHSAAIALFKEQLFELGVVRQLSSDDPKFKSWRDTTNAYFQKFLRDSPHFKTFTLLTFTGRFQVRPYGGYSAATFGFITEEQSEKFNRDCAQAEESIKAAIKQLEIFGVDSDLEDLEPFTESDTTVEAEYPRASDAARVQQTFHGPVVIHHQAIATDQAIQTIERMGDASGESFKQIAALLNESLELTGRQKLEGLKAIEDLAKAEQTPEEKKDWKSTLVVWQALAAIAEKATDVTAKLGPHMHNIYKMIEAGLKSLGH